MKFSNIVPYNSPDGLPRNPYPLKVVPTTCTNEACGEEVTEPVCPRCGTDVDLDFEPDYEAGEREFDKYD